MRVTITRLPRDGVCYDGPRMSAMSPCSRILLGLASLLLTQNAHGQCALTWQQFNVSAVVDVGHNWDPDGTGPATPLFAFGGGLVSIPGFSSSWMGAATYDPASGAWAPLSGLLYEVDALTTDANDQLVAGGGAGLLSAKVGSVDRWNGSTWANLGTTDGYVWSLVTLTNGDVVAGGDFTQVNGVPANHVARYDGSNWHAMNSGIDGRVLSLNLSPAGELVAAGWFSAAGGAPTDGGIVRWSGSAWVNLPPGSQVLPQLITAFAFRPNGSLVACGAFFDLGTQVIERVAEWDGSGWRTFAQGPDNACTTVAILPGGDALIGGSFQKSGGVTTNNVARWDGSAWSALGSGLGTAASHQVINLTVLPSGDVMAGGFYGNRALARLSTSCPASSATFGAGCAGSGGLNTLTAAAAAWTGSVARAEVTGVQPGSLALVLWGFGQLSLPLSTISPVGQPGCTLLVTPDLLVPSTAAGTAISTQIPIPNDAALAGLALDHQVALVEIGVGGTFTNFTSTNGLTFTIGVF